MAPGLLDGLRVRTELLHQIDATVAAAALAFPEVGTEVAGRYRVVRMLGRGGMAAVFEAENVEFGSRVALKVLDPDVARASSTMVDRFLREARITARVAHPNVVRVYDAGWGVSRRGSLPFIAMELLEGRSLDQLLSAEGMPVARALSIADQVLSVLEAAHPLGIVHRDLKPANVRVLDGDQVKVLDFGISKALRSVEALTWDGCFLGTPAFMAPEQLREPRTVDARADLFSVGALLYCMLTARLPFEVDPVRVLAERRYGEASGPAPLRARRPDVGADLAAVVYRALRPDPTDRWESAAAMRSALEDARPTFVGTDLPTLDSADPTARVRAEMPTLVDRIPPRSSPPPARRRTLAAIGTMFLAVLVGAASMRALWPHPSATFVAETRVVPALPVFAGHGSAVDRSVVVPWPAPPPRDLVDPIDPAVGEPGSTTQDLEALPRRPAIRRASRATGEPILMANPFRRLDDYVVPEKFSR